MGKNALTDQSIQKLRNLLEDSEFSNKRLHLEFHQGEEHFYPFFARIIGKYTGSDWPDYPEEASYVGIQVVFDSNADWQDADSPIYWGLETSSSTSEEDYYEPIIDLSSLTAPYYDGDTVLQRIPNDTIVMTFQMSDEDGNLRWYCMPANQVFPESFSHQLIDDGGVQKLRMHEGDVYGINLSETASETIFNLVNPLWIYCEITLDVINRTFTVDGMDSATSRPTEVEDTSCSERKIKVPLVSVETDNLITVWHTGDIHADQYFNDLMADDGSTCSYTDFTYTGEHQEAAYTDSGWNRDSTEAVKVTLQTGTSYYHTGDKKIYAYFRDFHFDNLGNLISISSEVRSEVDAAEPC